MGLPTDGAEPALRDTLVSDLLLYLDNRKVLDQFEDIAQKFYNETGFLRPGKSMPLEMQGGDEQEKRRQACWTSWCAEWRLRLITELEAVLASSQSAEKEKP